MCFRERSYIISKLKRTVKMIDFLYKSKVQKSILLRTVHFVVYTEKHTFIVETPLANLLYWRTSHNYTHSCIQSHIPFLNNKLLMKETVRFQIQCP